MLVLSLATADVQNSLLALCFSISEWSRLYPRACILVNFMNEYGNSVRFRGENNIEVGDNEDTHHDQRDSTFFFAILYLWSTKEP